MLYVQACAEKSGVINNVWFMSSALEEFSKWGMKTIKKKTMWHYGAGCEKYWFVNACDRDQGSQHCFKCSD